MTRHETGHHIHLYTYVHSLLGSVGGFTNWHLLARASGNWHLFMYVCVCVRVNVPVVSNTCTPVYSIGSILHTKQNKQCVKNIAPLSPHAEDGCSNNVVTGNVNGFIAKRDGFCFANRKMAVAKRPGLGSTVPAKWNHLAGHGRKGSSNSARSHDWVLRKDIRFERCDRTRCGQSYESSVKRMTCPQTLLQSELSSETLNGDILLSTNEPYKGGQLTFVQKRMEFWWILCFKEWTGCQGCSISWRDWARPPQSARRCICRRLHESCMDLKQFVGHWVELFIWFQNKMSLGCKKYKNILGSQLRWPPPSVRASNRTDNTFLKIFSWRIADEVPLFLLRTHSVMQAWRNS